MYSHSPNPSPKVQIPSVRPKAQAKGPNPNRKGPNPNRKEKEGEIFSCMKAWGIVLFGATAQLPPSNSMTRKGNVGLAWKTCF